MASDTITGLVLQGGGALGAYELGAAQYLYRDTAFAPDVVAGVSIGAITAVLLARPKGRSPLAALEEFWRLVAVDPNVMLPWTWTNAALWGNRHFFVPRLDVIDLPNWTYFYDTAPLKDTLRMLVDTDALADPAAKPRLVMNATNVATGKPRYFDSVADRLTLDHVMASGSLPPSFPATTIDGITYWDGGLFDNTPLGAVIDRLRPDADVRRTIFVVNLFPNQGPIPKAMPDVITRMLNLQFANRTEQDVSLLRRFNQVSALMEALAALPADHPVFKNGAVLAAYNALCKQRYVSVPEIISITQPREAQGLDGSDFSSESIKARAAKGYRMAEEAARNAFA